MSNSDITASNPAELKERYDEVIRSKRAEAERLPGAIATYKCGEGHGFSSFILSGPKQSVRITYNGNKPYSLLTFADPEMPVYEVAADSSGALTVEFAGHESDAPTLSSMLQLASTLSVAPNELVPYGWIEDGRITAILYFENVHHQKINGVSVNDAGVSCFVLEGTLMPVDLKMVSRDTGWVRHIWDLIEAGMLVRLTDRIKNLPEEVWVKFNKRTGPYLEFDASDGRLPAFVPKTPYGIWHPRETYPGELFSADFHQGTDYANKLRDWFR